MNSIFLDVGIQHFPHPTFLYCAKYHPGQANLVLTVAMIKWFECGIKHKYIYIDICIQLNVRKLTKVVGTQSFM